MDTTIYNRRANDSAEIGLPARRLERVFGRTAREWTIEDLVRLVKEHSIRIVSLMHVGSDGWLKTLDFVPLSESHLRDVLEGGERADGSSIFAGTGIRAGASDILLRPRVSAAFLNPFSKVPALVLLCSHAGRDGAAAHRRLGAGRPLGERDDDRVSPAGRLGASAPSAGRSRAGAGCRA